MLTIYKIILNTLYGIRYTKHTGFTVIEILVAISIVVLIVSMSVAGYTFLNQRQKLINAGQGLKNTLRDVQSRAYTSETDCNICDCTPNTAETLDGWYADFSTGKMYGSCNGNTFPAVSAQPPLSIPTDVLVTPYITPAGTRIFYRSHPPSSGQTGTICLSQTALPTMYYVIRMDSGGNISDAGGLTASCP
jgi:prepilin-type N-terminal cleavage/methylation domain-containing protein